MWDLAAQCWVSLSPTSGMCIVFGANLAHFCGPLCRNGSSWCLHISCQGRKSPWLYLISQGGRGHFLPYSPAILWTSSCHLCTLAWV